MKIFLEALCVVALIAAVSATDYCTKACINYENNLIVPHIACNHTGNFTASCPSDADMVNMNDTSKRILLKAHNTNRNFIAGGVGKIYRPACRMATMEWDDELASHAALNVMQCDLRSDHCHTTDKFTTSGQLIFWRSTMPPPGFNDEGNLQTVVDSFYQKFKDYKLPDWYPNKKPSARAETVLMSDHNIRVGCAASTYTRKGLEYTRRYYLATCNYAITNIPELPIYDECDNATTLCKTGNNPEYPNLCSTAEEYDLSQWALS